jgi:hypothetical protein
MRVVTVVGIPTASVAVEVIKVYHGGSTWVGGDSMRRKESNYRAVKKKKTKVVSRERECPGSN